MTTEIKELETLIAVLRAKMPYAQMSTVRIQIWELRPLIDAASAWCRLQKGEIAPEEIHNLCHNLEKTVPRCEFEKACADYVDRLYGQVKEREKPMLVNAASDMSNEALDCGAECEVKQPAPPNWRDAIGASPSEPGDLPSEHYIRKIRGGEPEPAILKRIEALRKKGQQPCSENLTDAPIDTWRWLRRCKDLLFSDELKEALTAVDPEYVKLTERERESGLIELAEKNNYIKGKQAEVDSLQEHLRRANQPGGELADYIKCNGCGGLFDADNIEPRSEEQTDWICTSCANEREEYPKLKKRIIELESALAAVVNAQKMHEADLAVKGVLINSAERERDEAVADNAALLSGRCYRILHDHDPDEEEESYSLECLTWLNDGNYKTNNDAQEHARRPQFYIATDHPGHALLANHERELRERDERIAAQVDKLAEANTEHLILEAENERLRKAVDSVGKRIKWCLRDVSYKAPEQLTPDLFAGYLTLVTKAYDEALADPPAKECE